MHISGTEPSDISDSQTICDIEMFEEGGGGLQPLEITFVHHSVRKGKGCIPKMAKNNLFGVKFSDQRVVATPATPPPPLIRQCRLWAMTKVTVCKSGKFKNEQFESKHLKSQPYRWRNHKNHVRWAHLQTRVCVYSCTFVARDTGCNILIVYIDSLMFTVYTYCMDDPGKCSVLITGITSLVFQSLRVIIYRGIEYTFNTRRR